MTKSLLQIQTITALGNHCKLNRTLNPYTRAKLVIKTSQNKPVGSPANYVRCGLITLKACFYTVKCKLWVHQQCKRHHNNPPIIHQHQSHRALLSSTPANLTNPSRSTSKRHPYLITSLAYCTFPTSSNSLSTAA